MRVAQILFALLLAIGTTVQAQAEDMPELATLLSLFSANAMEGGTIRLNWTLDQQSPAVIKFRVYRGYEELGKFPVLCEIRFHAENGAAEYLYNDTSAIPGVTYYYKLAAQGQLHESVFPVVISAGIPLGDDNGGQAPDAPALVLPGDSLRLYVRKSGHYKLERTSPDNVMLLDSDLSAGVYEIKTATSEQSLKLTADPAYERTVSWPLR
jgi:hypothetical protein